jgi:hypothetical protein
MKSSNTTVRDSTSDGGAPGSPPTPTVPFSPPFPLRWLSVVCNPFQLLSPTHSISQLHDEILSPHPYSLLFHYIACISSARWCWPCQKAKRSRDELRTHHRSTVRVHGLHFGKQFLQKSANLGLGFLQRQMPRINLQATNICSPYLLITQTHTDTHTHTTKQRHTHAFTRRHKETNAKE